MAALTLGWAATILACGNGGPAPVGTSPTSEAGTPSPHQSSATCDIDLATGAPDATLFGADAGDFLADRFSLATADLNGDGRDDLLVGAPLADGPDNSRTNAGEAYVIFGAPRPRRLHRPVPRRGRAHRVRR